MLRVAIVGSRRRNSPTDILIVQRTIEKFVDKYGKSNVIFISGGCSEGADKFCAEYCKEKGYNLDEKLPKYKLTGEKVDYETACKQLFDRNKFIAFESDVVIGLVMQDPEHKGGTWFTLNEARKLKRQVVEL